MHCCHGRYDAEEGATRRQTSGEKSRNASTLAGANRRDGRIANNGNVSPGQSGKRSTSVPLATKGSTLSARTCAIPAPATQAAIIVSTSASINRPTVLTGRIFSAQRNSHSKGLPRCGSMYWMQSWAASASGDLGLPRVLIYEGAATVSTRVSRRRRDDIVDDGCGPKRTAI